MVNGWYTPCERFPTILIDITIVLIGTSDANEGEYKHQASHESEEFVHLASLTDIEMF